MIYNIISSTFHALCFMIIDQTWNGGLALPSMPYSPTNSSENWNKNGQDERIYKEETNDVVKNFERLKTFAAEHYKRKAAFFEKEVEICLTEIEKCNLTMKDLKDHRATPTALQMGTSHLYASATEKGRKLLNVTQMSNQSSTKKEKITVTEDFSQNHIVNLTQKAELEKKQKSLLSEFIKKESEFYARDAYELNLTCKFTSDEYCFFKEYVIGTLERTYKSHLPKVIEYQDVARNLSVSLNEKEIVFADLILAKLEDLDLIQRSQKLRWKPSLPQDDLEKVITAQSVLWVLFMLTGHHQTLRTLRSGLEKEPNLSLYEFCWSVSKLSDRAVISDCEYAWSSRVRLRQALDELREKYGFSGPVLRSMDLILKYIQ